VDVSLDVAGEGIYGYVSNRVVTCNNIVIGPLNGTTASHGIDFAYGDDLTRNGNTICGFGKGMSMNGTKRGTITGNVITQTNGMGMDLQYAAPSDRRMIVSSNIISLCAGTGIVMTAGVRHTLIGNIIFENNAGIALYDAAIGSDGNIISSNIIIDNTTYGILVNTSSENILLGNYIADNGTDGISLVDSSTLNHITTNTIIDNGRHGVSIGGSDENFVKNNIIKGNDSGDSATYDGVYLVDADNNIIEGNHFKDNDRYEINISNSGCATNKVLRNTFSGSDHTALLNNASTSTIFETVNLPLVAAHTFLSADGASWGPKLMPPQNTQYS